MCDFCENRKKINDYGENKGLFWINHYEELSQYTLVSSDENENNRRGLDISFCPICGRKLTED